MKILKFGGSSIADLERIKNVLSIVKKASLEDRIAVVFSAFGGVTEDLLKCAHLAKQNDLDYQALLLSMEKRHLQLVKQLIPVRKQSSVLTYVKVRFNELEDLYHGIFLIKEFSPRTSDYVVSFGERISTYIMAEGMRENEMDTLFVDARELIRTNDRFGNAKVIFPTTNQLISDFYSKNAGILVITGFVAATEKGETTTIGRSGSDYTAAIFAAALKADSLEIWTDVTGVMTADPRLVYSAITIPQLSYNEAMELSHFGAKVVFPATMQPAMKRKIPVYIKNTFKPEEEGTLICEKPENNKLIKGISSLNHITLLNVQGSGLVEVVGVSSRVFGTLAKADVNVVLISQASSEHSICIAIKSENANLAREALENEFHYEILAGEMDKIQVMPNMSVIAVVGENMKHHPGASGRLFQALGRNNINVSAVAQGSSELNISAVIKQSDLQKGLNALHEAFFLSDNKVLHVFLVGVGLIGKTLVAMIQNQLNKLQEDYMLDIKIHGLANSRYMAFDEDGFDLSSIPVPSKSDLPMDLSVFLNTMNSMNFSNSVLVDCTASQEVADTYERVLSSKVAIVTPNKKANSSSLENYKSLKKLSGQRNIKFLYETNVAAGLPVISTLQDLILSGDKVLKVEGVLSGSMNFIFSELSKGIPFSKVVEQAKEKGFTEPDPRDDLSGMDVARKILILGREAEQDLHFEDVSIQSMVPDDCKDIASVDAFLEKLKEHDAYFKGLVDEANEKEETLRFMAVLENGKATVGLKSVDKKHPFYSLEGSDNMILFTTERYHEFPMIIRGPGAGADVTAAGVFADIIRLGNYSR
ncbi:bifunctional aspartate kinase/homoserine dehydrogenase I [Cyclobacterium qasimii]|uniref:Homoserine dehydrogenase n=2 Tax=Cyclobacterium qasimii TaxID=1350429 RepID=S7WJF1_9BACT|nr:bifunctional aspartate kinase/homoserine dehydrogenase I [Cyclobacterium qasimii]EPR66844.1 Homoserine dehydrogenase [Cyclobacterium qasimii M12-11B]GEO22892.1 bifunctional aspartate kinase/homoserine dehydrogenase I [Cyclobacterium qasimii]